jgi:hypothetical protein
MAEGRTPLLKEMRGVEKRTWKKVRRVVICSYHRTNQQVNLIQVLNPSGPSQSELILIKIFSRR